MRTIEVVIVIPRWRSSVAISISIGSSRFGRRSEPSYVELLPGVHRENLLHLLVEFRSRFRAMTVDLLKSNIIIIKHAIESLKVHFISFIYIYGKNARF